MPPDARLTSAMLVGALRRRVADAGGFATILVKGDALGATINANFPVGEKDPKIVAC